jgi:hypothetical protein
VSSWSHRRVPGPWAGASLWLWLLLGCGRPVPFACQEDAQCRLDGEPGICTEHGHCAYADSACASGWRYPIGVGPALGGSCAPGSPITGAGTDLATSSVGSESTATTSDDETTGDVPGTHDTTGMMDPTTSGTTSDTEPQGCGDPDNTTPELAPTMPLACEQMLELAVGQERLDQWYWFDVASVCHAENWASYTGSTTAAGRLCMYSRCNPFEGGVLCGELTEPAQYGEFSGCCVDDGAALTMFAGVCTLGGEQLLVQVSFAEEAEACSDYLLRVRVQ